MKILVCSKISIPAKDRTLPAWEHLRSLGHDVVVEHPDSVARSNRPDAIISMGVSIMEETFEAMRRFPGVPVYCYQWDCYEWVWEPGQGGKKQAVHESRGQEYDYLRYGELLRLAKEVWVPSWCTGERTTQWWDVNNWRVILSSCPWWDYANVRDDGYALCTLRHIPDPWDTMFEKCCEDLAIPYKRTDHNLSYDDYQDAVASCRFLVSHYYEASTGGLTLMEGYYLGKPVLLNDSRWNGARDYFGDRACYFEAGSVSKFMEALQNRYDNPTSHLPLSKEYITHNFSDLIMVEKMMERIHANA